MKFLIILLVAVFSPSVFGGWLTTGQRPTLTIRETIDDDVEIKDVSSDRYLFSAFYGGSKRVRLSDLSSWESVKISAAFSSYLNGNNNASRGIPYSGFQTFSYGVTNADLTLDINATVQLDSMITGGIKLFIGEPEASVLASIRPNDASVMLRQNFEGKELASIRFGGYPSIAEQIYYRDLLLYKLGDRAKDYYTYGHLVAIFDPVWKFWDRRNELWLEKKNAEGPKGDLFL